MVVVLIVVMRPSNALVMEEGDGGGCDCGYDDDGDDSLD